jgi:Domain of unknown function (DUF4288)
MEYFSARLLYIILVNNGRKKKRNHYDEVVIVFRARDFNSAFKRALQLGRAQETKYQNHRKQTVRWALVKIINLDCVAKKIDGKEVASNLYYHSGKTQIAPTTQFRPEKLKPQGSLGS